MIGELYQIWSAAAMPPLSGKKAVPPPLVTQVANEHVHYWIDGKPVADPRGHYAESMMSIHFNLWFIRNGLLTSSDTRCYDEDIDWVFFSSGVLTPDDVDAAIADLRKHTVSFRDTVAGPVPPLSSPCHF